MAEEGVVSMSVLAGIRGFDTEGDQNSLGLRWKKWKSFDLYGTGKGIQNGNQKKALLLHTAGPNVQDIYFTLVEPAPAEEETTYTVTKRLLDRHFEVRVNVPYER